MRKTITVNFLNKIHACSDAVEAFKNQKETDPIKVLKGAMKIDRFDWANWLIVRLMNCKQKFQYSIFAALSVIKIFEKEYPDDKRPRNVIEAAKKVFKNNTSKNRSAESAARSAAWSAEKSAARSAVESTERSAKRSAAWSAWSAARSAVESTVRSAEGAVESAVRSAVWSAEKSAARGHCKKLQKKIINYGIKILQGKA